MSHDKRHSTNKFLQLCYPAFLVVSARCTQRSRRHTMVLLASTSQDTNAGGPYSVNVPHTPVM